LRQEFDYQLPNLELPILMKGVLNFIGWLIVFGSLVYAILVVNFHYASKWSYLLPVLGMILMIVVSYVLTCHYKKTYALKDEKNKFNCFGFDCFDFMSQ
jgi:hypothetical protein